MASEIISETSSEHEQNGGGSHSNVDMSSATTSNKASIVTMPTSHVVSNKDAIEALLKRSGYPLVQENGQRKYGPPPSWPHSEPPDRSCEVFIGKIPRDCFEDELVPLMERVGYVYEFRLMMEYSGYNRGYGFAMFTNRDDAKKAVNELNNFEIRKGRTIGVCRSVDNCRLFVGGIPKTKKKEEILDEMRRVTDDVMNIIVYPSAHDKTKNRGFAFVQYANHRAAAIARRKLIQNKIQLFEQPIAVDWAEPEPEVDESVMATVKVLYVRNLMLTTTEDQIKLEFERIKEGSVERVKKLKDFAFVHFKEREDALNALSQMNGATLDGAVIECSLSKPAEKSASSASLLKLTKNVLNNPTAALVAAAANNQLLDINMLLNSSLIGLPYHQAVDPMSTSLSPPGAQILPYLTGMQPQLSHQLAAGAHPHPALFGSYMPPTGYDLNAAAAAAAAAHHFLIPSDASSVQSVSPTNSASGASITITSAPSTAMSSVPTSVNATIIKTANGNAAAGRPVRSGGAANGGLMINGQNGLSNARTTAGMYRSAYNGVGFAARNVVPGGTVKKQASSQEVPYDLYTAGINPVPLLPINQNQMPGKYGGSAVQILEEFCGKESLGIPVYSLHTTNGVDQDGKEIGLYTYKVCIPGLFNGAQLTNNKLSKTIDEAKNEAAAYALAQIIPPTGGGGGVTAQPSFIDLNEIYYNSAVQQAAAVAAAANSTSQTTSPSTVISSTAQQTPQQSASAASSTTSLTPPTLVASAQPMGLLYPPHDTTNNQLSPQELQSIIAASAGQSGGLNNLSINNDTLLKNWQLAAAAAAAASANNSTQGPNNLAAHPPPPEYFQTVIPQPQYIIDPSGKYLLCQTLGWQ